jgi:hypothetical protein
LASIRRIVPVMLQDRPSWVALSWLLVAGCSVSDRYSLAVDSGEVCASCGGCEEMLPVRSAQHVSGPVAYPDNPPVGGPHSACWGPWGVQEVPVRVERWVHNLEHGGVVLLYRCEGGCEAELQQLRAFVSAHPRTVLTAYDALPARFAAVSWGFRLLSDCLDLGALESFYAEHYDRGPESIASAPPVQCSEFPEL